jgi:hypothetical protein
VCLASAVAMVRMRGRAPDSLGVNGSEEHLAHVSSLCFVLCKWPKVNCISLSVNHQKVPCRAKNEDAGFAAKEPCSIVEVTRLVSLLVCALCRL